MYFMLMDKYVKGERHSFPAPNEVAFTTTSQEREMVVQLAPALGYACRCITWEQAYELAYQGPFGKFVINALTGNDGYFLSLTPQGVERGMEVGKRCSICYATGR